MTDTYEDLIRRLRYVAKLPDVEDLEFKGMTVGDMLAASGEAADAIAALVKERDEMAQQVVIQDKQLEAVVEEMDGSYQRSLRDGERIGLEKAAIEADKASEWNGHSKGTRIICKGIAVRIRALITQEQSDDDKV